MNIKKILLNEKDFYEIFTIMIVRVENLIQLNFLLFHYVYFLLCELIIIKKQRTIKLPTRAEKQVVEKEKKY
jgi:hypothetical protein